MFASHVAYPVGLSCHNSYSTSLHKIRDGILLHCLRWLKHSMNVPISSFVVEIRMGLGSLSSLLPTFCEISSRSFELNREMMSRSKYPSRIICACIIIGCLGSSSP